MSSKRASRPSGPETASRPEISRKIKQRIVEATQRLAVAEGELVLAMAELTVSDRADKQIVGERLRRAMAELVVARSSLAELVEP